MSAPRPLNRRPFAARDREATRSDPRGRGGSRQVRRAEPGTGDSGSHGPSSSSTRGLDAFTFFIANLQTGFGPFLAVYFTQQKWTQTDIGLALTIGSLVGLLGQIPGGAFVDSVRSKRFAAGFSAFCVGASAMMLAILPTYLVVLSAMAIHAAASCVLTPSIAAISIGLVGHERAGERLGRNASFSAIGNALGAASMGAIGYYLSNNAVFLLAGALVLPALFSLSRIRGNEITELTQSKERTDEKDGGIATLLTNRDLVCFAGCMILFFLANAALLPLLGSVLTMRASETATALVAACIMVPQAVLAVTAPLVGRYAQIWGRKPMLAIGFAALPVRALLFAYIDNPYMLVAVQVLDGISASVLGVLVPLVVSDVTRKTGRFNVALGAVGTGMGLGAALSTSFGGFMADRFGSQTAFLWLGLLGILATVLVLCLMRETKPEASVSAAARPEPRRGAAKRSSDVQVPAL